jgi:hypothetical protein
MAQNPAPLSELIKINDQNLSDVDGISDLLQDAPLLNALVADFASNGTQHKYLKETAAPVVGFRSINDGRDQDHSEDTKVSLDLALLDCSYHVDQMYADEYRYGAEAWLARESQRALQAGFFKAEQQLIYGTGADAAGFTGLADASTINGASDPMVVNAGGSTDVTSVYVIRSVPALTDVTLITGNDGNISVGDTYQQMMDGSTTGIFNAYVTPVSAYLGLQIGSIYSVGRICNIDAGANGLTDEMISDALSRFPAARGATHLCMNRRSLQQLQASRTATNPTGAPAPFPQSSFNVPIITSDAVTNSESVLV